MKRDSSTRNSGVGVAGGTEGARVTP